MSVSLVVTSLSILNLITNPGRRLLFTVAVGLQALGSFSRTQDFLQLEKQPVANETSSSDKSEGGQVNKDVMAPSAESTDLEDALPKTTMIPQNTDPGTKRTEFEAVSSLLKTCFVQGSLMAVTGPIGCGKSTVLRSLLPREADTHLLTPSEDIAYCSQTPWIHNGTISDNIVGQSGWDPLRYEESLRSCELQFDLSRMPEGDATVVGSTGSALSGGQRQRIVSYTGKGLQALHRE